MSTRFKRLEIEDAKARFLEGKIIWLCFNWRRKSGQDKSPIRIEPSWWCERVVTLEHPAIYAGRLVQAAWDMMNDYWLAQDLFTKGGYSANFYMEMSDVETNNEA